MRSTVLLLLAGVSTAIHAEYLEVRRTASIYEHPSKESERLTTVAPAAEDGVTILHVVRGQAIEHGFIKIRLPEGPGYGYVYKTAGRIYADNKGRFKPYNRNQYRHWIDEDHDCEDTRVEVLMRDGVPGKAKISKKGSVCRVVSGAWNDPYTGKTFTDPKALDVDHFVPLKNAHVSGGWAWSAERKREYANNLEDVMHLLAVSASENRKKGDKGPNAYMPPNEDFRCEYVENWLDVKYRWGLDIPLAEQQAIDDVLADCPESDLQ